MRLLPDVRGCFFHFISQRAPVWKYPPARAGEKIVCICRLSGAFQRHGEPRNGNLTSARTRWPREKKAVRSLRESGNGSTMMKIMTGGKGGGAVCLCVCVWTDNEERLLVNIKLEYKGRRKARRRLQSASAQTRM